MGLADTLRKLVDGTEHVLGSEVAEHERTDLGAGIAEGLGPQAWADGLGWPVFSPGGWMRTELL